MDLLLIFLIIFIPIIAQIKINGAYKKYSKVDNSMNITGKDVARMILDKNDLQNITIGQIGGNLTDHYDPSKKNINLSQGIYSDKSVASVAVAAHEVGHAIQDKENYGFLRMRTALVPIVNITSGIASYFVFFGFLFEALNLFYIGIALLLVGLLFQLVTLPVEFDASRRGIIELKKCGLVSTTDEVGTKKVLKASALTYVAGFLAMALQIIRLILINRNNN